MTDRRADDVAKELGISQDQLRAEGFQIQMKLASDRNGSDKCSTFSFRHDQAWRWAKGRDPKSSEYSVVGPGFTLVFKAARTNSKDAKCEFRQVAYGGLTGLG